MAPEILKGFTQGEADPYNHKVDIWSIGVIIYEMMTGNTPFGRPNNHRELMQKIKTNPIFFPT